MPPSSSASKPASPTCGISRLQTVSSRLYRRMASLLSRPKPQAPFSGNNRRKPFYQEARIIFSSDRLRTLGLYNLRPELPRTRKSSDVECLLLAGDGDIYPCISILWMGNSTPLVQKAYCSSHRSTRTPCNTRAIRVGHLYTAMWCIPSTASY